jgi:hypothetical protein
MKNNNKSKTYYEHPRKQKVTFTNTRGESAVNVISNKVIQPYL